MRWSHRLNQGRWRTGAPTERREGLPVSRSGSARSPPTRIYATVCDRPISTRLSANHPNSCPKPHTTRGRLATGRAAPRQVSERRGSPRPGLRRRRLALRELRDLPERFGIVPREVGEDLAIDVDARGLEAGHEAAVAQAVEPGRGVDARDPEGPELALLLAAVAVRV